MLLPATKGLARQKRMQSEARGRHRANAYLAYAEVDGNRSNDAMRRLCPRGIAEQKFRETRRKGTRTLKV